jgi:TetR/AcrR family transcriptional regulator, repressor for neighboring sulfatase
MSGTEIKSQRMEALRGKDAVMDALVASARTLFAQSGPANVSVRDVASHAGVNHGLVHRHFGSKEALLHAVMEGFAERFRAGIKATDETEHVARKMFASLTQESDLLKILGHLLLAGADPKTFVSDRGGIRLLVESARERQKLTGAAKVPLPPEDLVIAGAAMTFGWQLFAPFFLEVAGIGNKKQADLIGRNIGKISMSLLTSTFKIDPEQHP